jgi:hypothetical protein
MRQLPVLIAMLFGLLAEAQGACVSQYPKWQADFKVFLAMMDCAGAEINKSGNQAAYLQQLTSALAGKRVHWIGTIRYIRKNRVFLNESIAPVEMGRNAARVLYFVRAPHIREWVDAGAGKKVRYTGKIGAAKVDAVGGSTPAFYVELLEVTIDPD